MQAADKARENRARRAATRRGFTLTKTRARDPLAVDYGWHISRGDEILAGPLRTLDDVEHELDQLAQQQLDEQGNRVLSALVKLAEIDRTDNPGT